MTNIVIDGVSFVSIDEAIQKLAELKTGDVGKSVLVSGVIVKHDKNDDELPYKVRIDRGIENTPEEMWVSYDAVKFVD